MDTLFNTAQPVMPTEAPQDKIEHLIKRAFDLGAVDAKLIDTASVAVAEWVRWKCQYGCPLYEKDAFHPPLAPDAETTRKMLGEYGKALLITSHKGKELSDLAVKLEGEAYFLGYYKAFAFAAFSSSSGGT